MLHDVENDWLLKYAATQDLLIVVGEHPMHLINNHLYSIPELDALSMLALLQRSGRHGAAQILYRPQTRTT